LNHPVCNSTLKSQLKSSMAVPREVIRRRGGSCCIH
jgi:hypothetical protein